MFMHRNTCGGREGAEVGFGGWRVRKTCARLCVCVYLKGEEHHHAHLVKVDSRVSNDNYGDDK